MKKLIAELIEENINWFDVRTWTTMAMGFETEEKLKNALTDWTKEKLGKAFKEILTKQWGLKEKDIYRIDVYLMDEENIKN